MVARAPHVDVPRLMKQTFVDKKKMWEFNPNTTGCGTIGILNPWLASHRRHFRIRGPCKHPPPQLMGQAVGDTDPWTILRYTADDFRCAGGRRMARSREEAQNLEGCKSVASDMRPPTGRPDLVKSKTHPSLKLPKTSGPRQKVPLRSRPICWTGGLLYGCWRQSGA